MPYIRIYKQDSNRSYIDFDTKEEFLAYPVTYGQTKDELLDSLGYDKHLIEAPIGTESYIADIIILWEYRRDVYSQFEFKLRNSFWQYYISRKDLFRYIIEDGRKYTILCILKKI